jgi:hypothetical protein
MPTNRVCNACDPRILSLWLKAHVSETRKVQRHLAKPLIMLIQSLHETPKLDKPAAAKLQAIIPFLSP